MATREQIARALGYPKGMSYADFDDSLPSTEKVRRHYPAGWYGDRMAKARASRLAREARLRALRLARVLQIRWPRMSANDPKLTYCVIPLPRSVTPRLRLSRRR
jgi:hypothetical protein